MKRMDQIKRRIGILLAAAMLGLSSCGAPADRESVQTSPETREEVTSGEEILPSSREAADPAPADTEKTAMETSETSDQSEPMTPDPATQRTIYGDYAGPVYRIPMPWDNEYSVFLDRYGNQLTWPEVPSQVTDVLTGEVRYYCCMHLQEDGSAGYVLYDTEGNVVLEESPNWVNQCMGSLLVRTSVEYMSSQGEDLSDKCVLYDPASGEAVAKNVFYLKKMSELSAIALDPDFHLVGILDENGTVLAGFPTEETYASPQPVGGYIKATLLKPGYSATVVLNDQCRCILHADGWDQEYRLFDCGKRGTYCGLQDWKEHTITTLYRTDPWESPQESLEIL